MRRKGIIEQNKGEAKKSSTEPGFRAFFLKDNIIDGLKKIGDKKLEQLKKLEDSLLNKKAALHKIDLDSPPSPSFVTKKLQELTGIEEWNIHEGENSKKLFVLVCLMKKVPKRF